MALPDGPCCASCPHAREGSRFIPPDGSGMSGVLLVGDSPWKDEQAKGYPFAGAAGGLLNRILALMPGGGLSRSDLTIWNTIQCQPAHLGWMDYPERFRDAGAAIEHCRPHLDELIAERRPKVIVPMGNVALRRICGVSGIEAHAGYVLPTPYGIPAVPAYHPSYLLRGKQALVPVVLWALKRAMDIAQKGYEESEYALLVDPAPDVLRRYVDSVGSRIPSLFVDIETPESAALDEEELEEEGVSFTITRAGFSVADGTAASFPWVPPYTEIMREALSRADEVVEWADNRFDTRRLAAAGMPIPSRIVSGMWCLQGRTRVRLADGRKMRIADIVDKRLPVTLLGMAEDGRAIPVNVVGWHKKEVRKQKWLRMTLDNVQNRLWVTPEHTVWTLSGSKLAEDIRVGDEVPIPRIGSESALQGTILGDGYVNNKGGLAVLHSVKQVVWAQRKADHFGARLHLTKPSRLGGPGVQFSVSVGRRYRDKYYTSVGRDKIFVPPINAAAVAVWYCDDGNWHPYPVKGRPDKAWENRTWAYAEGRVRLAIEGFNCSHQPVIYQWFRNRYGALGVDVLNLGAQGATLTLGKTARDLFFEDIHTYIPPEMYYKLPARWRGCYNGWLELKIPQRGIVTDIRESTDGGWRSHRYCVTVDHPTHRFFTEAGLVSNCWHWLQSDMRKGLGLVAPFYYKGPPWKHLSQAEPGRYNCLDNAIGRACYSGTKAALVAQGRWENFEKYCVQVTPHLELMGRAGLKIDRDYQQSFMDELRRDRDAYHSVIQQQVPDTLRPWKEWQRAPKNMEGVALYTRADGKQGWRRRLDWNPGSWQQVAALAKQLGVVLPRREASGGTVSAIPLDGSRIDNDVATDRKSLKRVARKYPVFADILKWRERNKLITAYNWPLDAGGRVHYTFGFHPSTWRKSCRAVNIQTIPKRNDLARQFRRMIVSGAGRLLIEADAAAIEAVLVGYLAGSPRYIRLAKAGVHGWLTSAFQGEPISLDLPDAELSRLCKAAKKKWPDSYEKIKRVLHLSNYLGTPRRIYEEYPDDFTSEGEARKLQQFYFSTEAGQDLKRWHRSTVERAHAEKGLENHFGMRHRFYNLFTYDQRRAEWVFGDDAKRAVAFVPQSDASFIQSDVLLRLARHFGYLEWQRAIVHDSFIIEVPKEAALEAAALLHGEMTKPLPMLEGLVIGAEVKIGRNLAGADEDNPEGMKEMSEWKPTV